MTKEAKETIKSVFWALLSIILLLGMVYFYYKSDPGNSNAYTMIVGILGALFGFTIGKFFSIGSDRQLDTILNASLIREKIEEVKTIEEAKETYLKEIENLKETIESEGRRLLLSRMREIKISELEKTFLELETIEGEIKASSNENPSEELLHLRQRVELQLERVANPEENERIVKHFFYSFPVFGNSLYLLYLLLKRFSSKKDEDLITQIKKMPTLVETVNYTIIAILLFVIILIFIKN